VNNPSLVDENKALRDEVSSLKGRLAAITKIRDDIEIELAILKRQLYGQKREHINHAQNQLAFSLVNSALERLAAGDAGAQEDAAKALDTLRNAVKQRGAREDKNAKSKAARQPLSTSNLPVVNVVIEPADVAQHGAHNLRKIGEDVSEHIDRRPASLVLVRVVRPKYVVKPQIVNVTTEMLATALGHGSGENHGSMIVQASMPDRIVPKSTAGPGLLAHVVVSKYGDHIPLNRQHEIFKREGYRISTSTLGDWVQVSLQMASTIVEAMWQDAHDAPYVLSDATGVLVQAPERCRRGHFYVVVVPGRSVLYRFADRNNGDTVAQILGNFRGKIQVDASSVYHELFRRQPDLQEVGCWAHARRKFFDQLDHNPEQALLGVGFINLLYDVHRDCMEDGVVDAAQRKERSQPILDALKKWVTTERAQFNGENPIAKACAYVDNHWIPLTRFLDDGALRLDNNPAELALRHEAVGRKNWLFLGSDEGALSNTTAVSLIASCKMHNVEPWAYLRDVFTLLPVWSSQDVLALAPARWKTTRELPATQKLFDEQRLLDRHVEILAEPQQNS
jgi:transposase